MLKKMIVFLTLAVTLAFTITSCEEDSSTEPSWYPIIRGTIIDSATGSENPVNVTKNVKVELIPNGSTVILEMSGLGGSDDNKEWKIEFKLDEDPDNRLRQYSTSVPNDMVKIHYRDTDPQGIGEFDIDYQTAAINGGIAIITLQTYDEGSKIDALFEGDIFQAGGFDKFELENGLIRLDVFE